MVPHLCRALVAPLIGLVIIIFSLFFFIVVIDHQRHQQDHNHQHYKNQSPGLTGKRSLSVVSNRSNCTTICWSNHTLDAFLGFNPKCMSQRIGGPLVDPCLAFIITIFFTLSIAFPPSFCHYYYIGVWFVTTTSYIGVWLSLKGRSWPSHSPGSLTFNLYLLISQSSFIHHFPLSHNPYIHLVTMLIQNTTGCRISPSWFKNYQPYLTYHLSP